MRGLQTGQIIHSILTTDAELKKIIGKRVYPLIADKGVQFPFITYVRTGGTLEEYNKGNREVVTMELAIIADKYKDSINVVSRVASILQEHSTATTGISITSHSESYIDDNELFIQHLSIEITIES